MRYYYSKRSRVVKGKNWDRILKMTEIKSSQSEEEIIIYVYIMFCNAHFKYKDEYISKIRERDNTELVNGKTVSKKCCFEAYQYIQEKI